MTSPVPRRLGRPRLDQTTPSGDPREQILAVAAERFAEVGFTRATTREIAAAAGLRQSSLFHYFPSKDAIFSELLSRVIDPARKVLDLVEQAQSPPRVKLYALVYGDTLNICSGPHNLARLSMLVEAQLPQFKAYWSRNADLFRGYERIIADGLSSGDFAAPEPKLAARVAYGTVEGVIYWFERGTDYSAEAAAHAVAATVLRGLLREGSDVRQIVPDALAIIADRAEAAPLVSTG